MKLARFLAPVVAVLVLCGTTQASRVFLSKAGEGADPTADLAAAPTWEVPLGATASFYLWVVPDEFESLKGLSLSVNSSNASVLQGTAHEIYNPRRNPNSAASVRWQGTGVGTLGDLMSNSNAAGVTSRGLDGTLTDSLFHAGTGAFLHSKITFNATALGSTNLFLAVGDKKIVNAEGAEEMNFGPSSDTQAVDGATVGATTNTPDGVITVVPEPASLALLAVGGLALLAARRRS